MDISAIENAKGRRFGHINASCMCVWTVVRVSGCLCVYVCVHAYISVHDVLLRLSSIHFLSVNS